MLEAIWIATIVVVTWVFVIYAAMVAMDRLRWWADAGLAAIIPMAAVAVPVATFVAGCVLWLFI